MVRTLLILALWSARWPGPASLAAEALRSLAASPQQQQQEERAIIPSLDTLLAHPITDVIKTEWEGFSPTPYLCPAGYWTIGYGHLCDKDHSPISREQGGQYLAEDLLDALRDVERLAPNLKDEPDHRAIACASWIMNLGKGNFASSTMLKRIREGKWEAAAKEMKRWDKVTVGGKKKPFRALTRRRLTEAHLFLTGEVKTFL